MKIETLTDSNGEQELRITTDKIVFRIKEDPEGALLIKKIDHIDRSTYERQQAPDYNGIERIIPDPMEIHFGIFNELDTEKAEVLIW